MTTEKVLHPTETMSQIANFDQWLHNWLVENADYIKEGAEQYGLDADAGEYFEQSIETEADAIGFWLDEEKVAFTDDMEWAKGRMAYHYSEWLTDRAEA